MKRRFPLETLLEEVRACRLCEDHLPAGPRPVLRVSNTARLLIVGQAPGRRVHETGIPFNDPSGDRLRDWLGLDRDTFYDERRIAIVPMGFCYPGTGKSGDLPPRPECAQAWRRKLLAHLGEVELTLAIGQYAINWHLAGHAKKTLTETVRSWRDHWPALVPLPHPSPRNNLWLRKNPWFETEVVPAIRERVQAIAAKPGEKLSAA
jgi:uracil-DNA glycosylase